MIKQNEAQTTGLDSRAKTDSLRDHSKFQEYDLHLLQDKVLGEDIIKFTNLSKVYKLPGKGENTVIALKNATLDNDQEFYPIKRGEFVMIRGPSGGGKTTLLNLIGTIDQPSSGELYIIDK
jgi:ABC-type glutathione transport system ATPase component